MSGNLEGFIEIASVDKQSIVSSLSNDILFVSKESSQSFRFGNDSNLGTEYVVINSNVGIGISNPSHKLDVIGEAYVSSNLFIGQNLIVNNNTLFVDSSNNFVGIGTNNPSYSFDVFGVSRFNSNLLVTGSNSIEGTLNVKAGTAFSNTLVVEGLSTFNSNIILSGINTLTTGSGAIKLGGTMQISGVTALSNNLLVSGSNFIDGTLNVKAGTALSNTLVVEGLSTFNSNITLSGVNTLTTGSGAIKLGGTMQISGITALSNNLLVSGSNFIDGTLNVKAGTALSNTLVVEGLSTFNSNITLSGVNTLTTGSGAIKLGGTMQVSGVTVLSNNLLISGSNFIDGTLNVKAGTALSNNLVVSGLSTFNSNITLSGINTLTTGTGATKLGGTLEVSNVTALSNNLFVTGSNFIDGTLNVKAGTALSNNLVVSGLTTFNSNITLSGINTLITGTGATKLGGTIQVSGVTALSNNLIVSGSNSIDGTLNVKAGAALSNNLVVEGLSTFNSNITLSGINTLTTGTGATKLGGTLEVSNVTSLSNNLIVTGTSTLNSLNVIGTGNIGIGTTIPDVKLHIYGTTPTLKLHDSSGTTTTSTSLISFFSGTSTEKAQIGYSASVDLIIKNIQPTGALRLYTANSEKLTILSSGLIGFGTSTPSENLHLYSAAPALRFQDTTGLITTPNTLCTFFYGTGAGTQCGAIGFSGTNDIQIKNMVAGGIRMYTGSTSERITVLNAGNVGIGSTIPTKKLDVVGDGKFSTSLVVGSTLTVGTTADIGTILTVGDTLVQNNTATYGSLSISGGTRGGFTGYVINNRYAFMSDSANTTFGLYDNGGGGWLLNKNVATGIINFNGTISGDDLVSGITPLNANAPTVSGSLASAATYYNPNIYTFVALSSKIFVALSVTTDIGSGSDTDYIEFAISTFAAANNTPFRAASTYTRFQNRGTDAGVIFGAIGPITIGTTYYIGVRVVFAGDQNYGYTLKNGYVIHYT